MKTFLKASLFSGNQDMTGALTSQAIALTQVDNVAVQLAWTGSPTGTFTVQGSIDYVPLPGGGSSLNAGTWTTITLPTTAATGGAAGTLLINMNDLGFPWMRVVYTPTSGTGTLTVAQLYGKAL